jgi:RNA polymerase sigma-70 factor, ECF subfamily
MTEGERAMGDAAEMINPDERAHAQDGSRLLARIARQDADALAELYHMWGDRLYSMALHWLKDEGAAQEVLQDCLLRVWKKAPEFDFEKSSGFTWCTMILRGLCLDHLRKRKRRAAVWHDWEMGSALEMPARSGVEDLFFRETVTRVRFALTQLDEAEAETIRTALFDPGTVHDHAARWQLPLGTAKIRIHRAMLKLRQMLNQGGYDESR